MNRLDGKVAIITGGAKGQGAAEAALFVEAGAHVVITDVDTKSGIATVQRIGRNCEFVEQDVASEESWSQLVDHVLKRNERIDILVNNAGIFRVLNMQDTSLDVWNQMIAINQTGVFLGMRAVAPHMKDNGSGSIINLSSIAGLGAAGRAHAYSATKWAVRGMSKSAAEELAPFGVRVNSVHPGYIETQMLDEFGDARNDLVKRVPMGKLAEAEDVAKLVLFLASDDSGYCTGHEFVVDGGVKS